MSEPFFVGPLLSLQTAVVAPWSMCTYWHTGQSLVWWSARADENVVRVGSVAWRAETAEWPVAISPGSLPTHRTWDSPEQSREATLLLISLPRITWLYDPWSRNMEYWNTQSWEKIQFSHFTVFTTDVWYLVALVRLVHQDPVCGLGGRAGYRAAYRHRGIQESTQGASHASQPPLSLVKPWTRHIVKTSNNRQKSVLS